ncbi:CocE/NonD family hydrolase [Mycobacterium sp. 852014-50255_SCH5639931]|uniref:CocE/NonD family hydrolase n=1 Tax=Mycobacterium sp. 852014-50255_SCH5639931 TaxID=1834112 RepID=UPI0007FE9C96|nr:CocE/NonD family hydrolase [Mycobacterium sp. 852014-50255_SCH5639931]OBB67995.1 hydrolase [Mycobacterium sp. 852014-50255_SCH5639931]
MARNAAPARDRPWRRPGALRYAIRRIRGVAKPPVAVTDPPADLDVERDVGVPTRDGTLLRVNVFRQHDSGARPVILSIHPYGKDNLPRRRGNKWTFSMQYRILRQPQPVRFSALTGWEAPDPGWWTAQGFVVVNADSRGCGRSDGTGRLLSRQEAEDTYDLVQWIAGQPWSDGRVVMLGVSYLAISQYAVAALQPPALRAICPWEGFTDAYRDLTFPGGVRETGFTRVWSRNVRRGTRQAYDLERMQDAHPLRDEFWRSLVPDLSAIKVPMLVCGSFSDNNLHSRGSIRAFTHAGSGHARLYTHRAGKWATFYSGPALTEQLRFFRGVLDGAPASRSVRLEVREDRDTVAAVREEAEWPLARTHWRPMYLAGGGLLTAQRPSAESGITFEIRSGAVAFSWTVPADIELTGPMAARLWIELDGCDDANLFVGVEKWRAGRFVGFEGSYGYGRDRVSTGWQRISLRTLDADLSRPWEPVAACTDPRPVAAHEVVEVNVALGPSATLFRAGEQLRLVVAGRWLCPRNPLTGQLPAAYAGSPRGRVKLHWGPRYDAHLLIPEIPG